MSLGRRGASSTRTRPADRRAPYNIFPKLVFHRSEKEEEEKGRIDNKLSRVASSRGLIIQHTPNKWAFGSPKHRWLSRHDCSILAAWRRGGVARHPSDQAAIWRILLPLRKIARHQTRCPSQDFSSRIGRCFRRRRPSKKKNPLLRVYVLKRKREERGSLITLFTIIDKT